MSGEIIILLLSLLFSAFFSGMEIAFVSANKMGLEVDKQKGTFTSNLLSIFSSNSEQYIATMMVGFTISLVIYGLAFVKIVEPKLSQFIISDLIVLILLAISATLLFLVTAEFLPKTLFKINANGILKAFAVPVILFYIVFFPIANFCMILSKGIIRLIFNKKVSPENDKNVFSLVDLDHFLNNSFNQEGIENDDEETEIELFKNALDFSKVKVRDCMIPRAELEAIDVTSSIDELKQKFIETGFSKILVYSENIDNIIGYVHSSQLFKNPPTIKTVVNSISFVPEAMMANRLLSIFTQKHKSIAIVVDEFGGISGMITIEDVLEEIFGEIEDEHDTDDLVVKKIKENEWILSARNEINLLNTKYHFNLPEDDEYETIAGLLLQHYENIPKINSLITIQNYEFRVLKASKTRIELVLMKIVPSN
jgi:CBS domain containing-hemolysin-like protein